MIVVGESRFPETRRLLRRKILRANAKHRDPISMYDWMDLYGIGGPPPSCQRACLHRYNESLVMEKVFISRESHLLCKGLYYLCIYLVGCRQSLIRHVLIIWEPMPYTNFTLWVDVSSHVTCFNHCYAALKFVYNIASLFHTHRSGLQCEKRCMSMAVWPEKIAKCQ